jgi:hypothetical protein
LAGDDASVEMELAKSLANKLDDVGADRVWAKVASSSKLAAPVGRPFGNTLDQPPSDARRLPATDNRLLAAAAPGEDRLWLWNDELTVVKPAQFAAERMALSLFE